MQVKHRKILFLINKMGIIIWCLWLKSVFFRLKIILKSVKSQHSCRHCHIQRTPDLPRWQNYLYASIFCHVHGGWRTTSWRSSIFLLIIKTSLPLPSRGNGRHYKKITLKLYLNDFCWTYSLDVHISPNSRSLEDSRIHILGQSF